MSGRIEVLEKLRSTIRDSDRDKREAEKRYREQVSDRLAISSSPDHSIESLRRRNRSTRNVSHGTIKSNTSSSAYRISPPLLARPDSRTFRRNRNEPNLSNRLLLLPLLVNCDQSPPLLPSPIPPAHRRRRLDQLAQNWNCKTNSPPSRPPTTLSPTLLALYRPSWESSRECIKMYRRRMKVTS